jgi:hypothetical protein
VAKNRASAILINNLVKTALAADSAANFDAGEYISRSVTLAKKSTDLKVLLDIQNTDDTADGTAGWDSVVVKYRTTKKPLRYVEHDAVALAATALDLSVRDNICYVYWINSVLTDPASAVGKSPIAAGNWEKRSAVVVDGFNTKTSPVRVYLSSIGDPSDFVVDGSVGTGVNPWTMVTTEADIDDTATDNVYVWNSLVTDTYATGEYVIEDYNLYVVNSATNAQPSLNSGVGGLYTRLGAIFTQDVIKVDTDSEWVLMARVSTPPPDFDITSQYYEHTFEPAVTPSEEFDNFAIKIEMYSDDEVHIPRCRRLRAIATV